MTRHEQYINNKRFYNNFALYICRRLGFTDIEGLYYKGYIDSNYLNKKIMFKAWIDHSADILYLQLGERRIINKSYAFDALFCEFSNKIGYDC
jgi:hypothetical protein